MRPKSENSPCLCAICGAAFVKIANRKTCSEACSEKLKARTIKERRSRCLRQPVASNCKKCGSQIEWNRYVGTVIGRGDLPICKNCRRCKGCGVEMKSASVQEMCRACWAITKKLKIPLTKCLMCGKEFRARRPHRHGKTKFCSHACNYQHKRTNSDKTRRTLRSRLHNRIWGAFSRRWSHKFGNRSSELTGCDVGFLKKWLESQFRRGMSWDNYGKRWHIDHKIPCAAFDLSDKAQAKACFHWTNLRPLEKRLNLQKHDKIEPTQLGLLMEVK